MQALYRQTTYSPKLAVEIESMGELAVSIANRWLLGWPDRVKALLKAGLYLLPIRHEWFAVMHRFLTAFIPKEDKIKATLPAAKR